MTSKIGIAFGYKKFQSHTYILDSSNANNFGMDINNDGNINILDVIQMINIILN